MKSKRILSVLIYFGLLASWLVGMVYYSPNHFIYQAIFCGGALLLMLITYFIPHYGFYIYIALIPLINIPARFFNLGAHESLLFISMAYVLGWWLNCIVTKNGTQISKKLSIPLMGLIFCCVSSMIWTGLRYADYYPFFREIFKDQTVNILGLKVSAAINRTLLSGGKFLVFPSVLWASVSILSKRHIAHEKIWLKITTIWAVALIPCLTIGLYQHLYDSTFGMMTNKAWIEAGRVSGCLTDPNALGLFLLIFIPLCFVAILKYRAIPQMILIVILLVAVFVITLSGSRSAILGLGLNCGIIGVGTMIYSIFSHKNKLRYISGAAVAGIIVILILGNIINGKKAISQSTNPVIKRLAAFVERSQNSNSKNVFDRRELQWKQAFIIWQDYPFAGIGIGAFPTELANYNRNAAYETPIDNAWNQYLNWLAELGILGLFLWMWLYWVCGKAIYKGVVHKRFFDMAGLIMLSTIAVYQVIFIFGVHLQSTEVSAGLAIVVALALIRTPLLNEPITKVTRSEWIYIGLIGLIIILSQVQNTNGPLSNHAINQRYELSKDYGFYSLELFPSEPQSFYYQWTQKNAGKIIEVPRDKRFLKLRMAGMNPKITPKNPQKIDVVLNGNLLDTVILTSPDWQEKEFYIYKTKLGPANLAIKAHEIWQPPQENPPRRLGIALATNIVWQSSTSLTQQGFSKFMPDLTGTNLQYRWGQKQAACKINSGARGEISFGLKAPANTPFYKSPIKLEVSFNGVLMKTINLSRDASEWTAITIKTAKKLRNTDGILSFSVNQLTTIRAKGTIRKEKVGFGITRIKVKKENNAK